MRDEAGRHGMGRDEPGWDGTGRGVCITRVANWCSACSGARARVPGRRAVLQLLQVEEVQDRCTERPQFRPPSGRGACGPDGPAHPRLRRIGPRSTPALGPTWAQRGPTGAVLPQFAAELGQMHPNWDRSTLSWGRIGPQLGADRAPTGAGSAPVGAGGAPVGAGGAQVERRPGTISPHFVPHAGAPQLGEPPQLG